MIEAANYHVTELLRDGRTVIIRALRPDDREELLAAAGSLNTQSLYSRFLGAKNGFSEKEISFFVNVDFSNHVALVAVLGEGDQPAIAGGGRYVVLSGGRAEVAFAVVDRCQGLGIGTLLMRHLSRIAIAGGLRELTAEVLPYNKAMLAVFENSGFNVVTSREPHATHVEIRLA
jgi:ribosomal protein S18 acetylase RimI-like enzyme